MRLGRTRSRGRASEPAWELGRIGPSKFSIPSTAAGGTRKGTHARTRSLTHSAHRKAESPAPRQKKRTATRLQECNCQRQKQKEKKKPLNPPFNSSLVTPYSKVVSSAFICCPLA
ncbi:hypothetical protein BDY21DRAFT_331938 [Lineolata rhizophorae]|uniref:Uncharacterized protein n=1 Tax=Lineolata rhizophorae TaxID=578093 RepID=A0A6A6PCA3_9PEZI|nr:hypothetical protein BDY21DRAFT_331938 [Lineolata rhizophorae]